MTSRKSSRVWSVPRNARILALQGDQVTYMTPDGVGSITPKENKMQDINTTNDFMIGGNNDYLTPLFPVKIATKQQAYRTAAWIKLLAEVLPDEEVGSSYEEIETAISNT